MRPSRAEVARTLVRGRLPGVLQLDGRPEPMPVPYATGADGQPLLLSRDGDELDTALLRRAGGEPPAAVLSVVDQPPVDRAPSHGRVRVHGRVRRLTAGEASAAVHEFAEANPVADLLAVGRGASICAVTVDRIRLDQRLASIDIDLAEFVAAEPDPLHELERDLLADLADHHAAQLDSYFRCVLAVTGVPCRSTPRAVRLDRYGFVVDVGHQDGGPVAGGWVRLSFTRPVHCRHDLAHLLHPVLFPTCPDPPTG